MPLATPDKVTVQYIFHNPSEPKWNSSYLLWIAYIINGIAFLLFLIVYGVFMFV